MQATPISHALISLTDRQARTGASVGCLQLPQLCTHFLAASACWKGRISVDSRLLTSCLRATFSHFTATLILRYTCRRRRSICTPPSPLCSVAISAAGRSGRRRNKVTLFPLWTCVAVTTSFVRQLVESHPQLPTCGV